MDATIQMNFGYDNSKKQMVLSCPTSSEWFYRFALGCKKRMGQDVRPDLAVSVDLLLKVLDDIVAIGSGTLCDLAKYAGDKLGKPVLLYGSAPML